MWQIQLSVKLSRRDMNLLILSRGLTLRPIYAPFTYKINISNNVIITDDIGMNISLYIH